MNRWAQQTTRAFWYTVGNESRLHSLPVAQLCDALTRKGHYFKGDDMNPGRGWSKNVLNEFIHFWEKLENGSFDRLPMNIINYIYHYTYVGSNRYNIYDSINK